MPEQYRYDTSIKSPLSDELLNTYVLRPLAGVIVRMLFRTPVTPNHVTIAAVIVGIAAAWFYAQGSAATVAAAGLLMTLKDILDSADGQLARAKSIYSRAGRFLDSIGDVLVNILVFAAIGWTLSAEGGVGSLVLSLAGLVGITIRVSYHVFYQTSYLHLEGAYERNRITEEITEEDRRGDPVVLMLQKVFLFLYGWQDRFMLRMDAWCRRGKSEEDFRRRWYGDAAGLRISGFLGFGTEFLVLTICSLLNKLELYLVLNLVLMNGIMLVSIIYRRWVLFPRLTVSGVLS